MKPRRRFFDVSYSGYSAWGGSFVVADRGWQRLRGAIATAHGYVDVVGITKGIRAWKRVPGRGSVQIGGYGPVTRLKFIWKNRSYDRTYPRLLTFKGATRVAARFARDVVSGKVRNG